MQPPSPDSPWWPIGLDEIAVRLGVTKTTVTAWRQRSKTWKHVPRFPAPRGRISGRDWWWVADIDDWAERAGRLPPEDEPPAGPVFRPKPRR